MSRNIWELRKSPIVTSQMNIGMAKTTIFDVNINVIFTCFSSLDEKFLVRRIYGLFPNSKCGIHVQLKCLFQLNLQTAWYFIFSVMCTKIPSWNTRLFRHYWDLLFDLCVCVSTKIFLLAFFTTPAMS